jgi:hypothetical protein
MTSFLLLLAALTPLALESIPAKPKVWPDVRQPLPQAYFVFQAAYLDDSRWPTHYHPFTVMVCNQSIAATGLRGMEWNYPDVKRMAYMDAQGIKVDADGAATGGTAYYDSLRAYFDSTYCVHVISTGECLRQGQNSPAWVPCKESIDILAQFHAAFTMNADSTWTGWSGGLFDGMYIDDCTAAYPNFRMAYIADSIAAGRPIDVNGDGVADDTTAVQLQWKTWRPYLTEKMREVVGEKPLIANSAGRIDDTCVNGICIEGIGHTATEDSATVWFQDQKAVGHGPFMGVGWVKTSADTVPTINVANAVPGVYFGLIE